MKIPLWKVDPLPVVCLILLFLTPWSSAEEEPDLTISDIRTAWQALRARLKNVDVTFTVQASRLDGSPRGMYGDWRGLRIVEKNNKVYQHVWISGDAKQGKPVVAEEREEGFDGKIVTGLYRQSGSLATGRVLPKWDGTYDPSPAHIFFKFTNVCPANIFEVGPFEVKGLQELRGRSCCLVEGRVDFTFDLKVYFDCERSFLPVQYQILMRRGGAIFSQNDVIEAKEIQPGFWFPVRTVTTLPRHDFRAEFVVEDVKINQQINDGIFRIQWPEGTIVSDRIIGTTYRIRRKAEVEEMEKYLGLGLTPKDTLVSVPVLSEKELEDTLNKALEQEKEAKSQKVSADQPDENAKAVSLHEIWLGWAWLMALAVIVFVIALLVRWHRARKAHK